MSDEWRRMLKEVFNREIMNVHTSFPGSVVEYDAETRRAKIQPYLKREMPDGTFMNFPIIHDVPVRYFGTKKYTVHLPLEVGDEVEVHICERAIDIWRDKGAVDNEDPDPRRFSIMDAYATPGLQPIEFIKVTEPGIVIKHHTDWDGDFISWIKIDDDQIQAKYKEKCQVTMTDDKIHAITEFCKMEMTKKVITVTNGISTMIFREDKFSEKNKTQSLFLILRDFMQEFYDHFTVGPPPKHKVSPVDKLKIKILINRLKALMEA